jgi:hypothetical protein
MRQSCELVHGFGRCKSTCCSVASWLFSLGFEHLFLSADNNTTHTKRPVSADFRSSQRFVKICRSLSGYSLIAGLKREWQRLLYLAAVDRLSQGNSLNRPLQIVAQSSRIRLARRVSPHLALVTSISIRHNVLDTHVRNTTVSQHDGITATRATLRIMHMVLLRPTEDIIR